MSGLEKLSRLGRFSAALQKLLLRRELIGMDEHGNRYFKRIDQHPNEGGDLERRWMRTPDGGYDPDKLPPEWAHWLRKTRTKPPTLEEVSRAAAARVQTQQKAAQLAAEDARRRFQRESLGLQDEAAPSEPRMDRYVEQLTGMKDFEGSRKDAANSKPVPPRGGPVGGKDDQQSAQKPSGSQAYEPEGWQPGKQ